MEGNLPGEGIYNSVLKEKKGKFEQEDSKGKEREGRVKEGI